MVADAEVTLDSGALIAIERGSRDMAAYVKLHARDGRRIVVPAAALAQAWRDGRRQARLASFLASRQCEVVALDEPAARMAGYLCARSGTSDVVDASVVVVARQRGRRVVTSDPDDLRRLDPQLQLVVI